MESIKVWVRCEECNGELHRVLPGEFVPQWECRGEIKELKVGQEIETEDIS